MGLRSLVFLAHRHGIAEVTISPSGAVLSSDVRRGAGTYVKGFRPAVSGLPNEVTLSGGLLPPGAVRVVAIDSAGREHEATCGNGAWLALLDQPPTGEPPVVRFLDADDVVVAVPLSVGVQLEAVTDAVDPCPVCNALEWRKVTAAPEDRYGSDGAGRPTAALCGRCGFEENLGVLYAAVVPPSWPADEDIDDTEAEIAEREAEAWQARIADARSTPFLFYGLTAGTPVHSGLGRSNGVVNSITVSYETGSGQVWVQTDTDHWLESPSWLAREALKNSRHEGDWPQLSATAIQLWLNARTRERVAEAHRASIENVDIAIDGKSTPFAIASLGNGFAAAARLPDATTILISGPGETHELALRTVSPDELQFRG